MNAKLFNTPFESSLRIVILLSIIGKPCDIDYITAIDFITLYGNFFSVTDTNINGKNSRFLGEYSARRVSIKNGIKNLIMNGLLKLKIESNKFMYFASEEGITFCDSLVSDYALNYKNNVVKTINHTMNLNNEQILKLVIQGNNSNEQ